MHPSRYKALKTITDRRVAEVRSMTDLDALEQIRDRASDRRRDFEQNEEMFLAGLQYEIEDAAHRRYIALIR